MTTPLILWTYKLDHTRTDMSLTMLPDGRCYFKGGREHGSLDEAEACARSALGLIQAARRKQEAMK